MRVCSFAPTDLTAGAGGAKIGHEARAPAPSLRQVAESIERAVILARGPLITVEDLPSFGGDRPGDDSYITELMELPLEQAVASLERRLIQHALTRASGNKTGAARILGIHRQHLYSKLKELGIE